MIITLYEGFEVSNGRAVHLIVRFFRLMKSNLDLDYDLNILAGCAIRYADAMGHLLQFRITELSD